MTAIGNASSTIGSGMKPKGRATSSTTTNPNRKWTVPAITVESGTTDFGNDTWRMERSLRAVVVTELRVEVANSCQVTTATRMKMTKFGSAFCRIMVTSTQ